MASKPTKVLVATFITLFLLLLNEVNSSDDLSFTFNKFEPNQKDILFQGDASVSSKGVIQVTKVENGVPISWSVGRALYAAPVHIWDSTTGREAGFATSFTFVVKAPDAHATADGMSFFLAPHDSQIPSGSTGGFLGLFNNSNYNSSNQIVAIEFDSFRNPWDPPVDRHIGIDVNTINSTKTVTWDWRNGEVAIATITYRATIKTLTVSLTYPSDQTSHIVNASVDLKVILPEWVRVGFSATTGQSDGVVETHDVLSWSFTSTFIPNNYAAMENNVHVARYTE